jgi:hypothetical protein
VIQLETLQFSGAALVVDNLSGGTGDAPDPGGRAAGLIGRAILTTGLTYVLASGDELAISYDLAFQLGGSGVSGDPVPGVLLLSQDAPPAYTAIAPTVDRQCQHVADVIAGGPAWTNGLQLVTPGATGVEVLRHQFSRTVRYQVGVGDLGPGRNFKLQLAIACYSQHTASQVVLQGAVLNVEHRRLTL